MALGCIDARRLTARLVELIECDRLSVAAAARTIDIPIETAGMLVRLHAIELECAETEQEERLDEIQAACPGEDWWRYSDRQLHDLATGRVVPCRIVRELVLAWQERTGASIPELAQRTGVDSERLKRAIALTATPPRRRGGRARWQRTITIAAASRIVDALGIPPCAVPGL